MSRIFKYTSVPIILFSILISCNSGRNSKTNPDSPKTDNTIVKNSESGRPATFTGLYISGDENNTFIDCTKSDKIYWVKDNTGKLQSLYHQATMYNSYPSESVYAELEGYVSGKGMMGSPGKYENVLVITHVIKVEAKNFRNDCYAYEFIALGNEPFWETAIIPAEKRIVLKDMSTEKVFDFPYKPAVINGGVYHYETSNDSGEALKITIRKEICSDGMSDRSYSYSSEVVINGRSLKGCAIKKGETFTDAP